jgi:hypothetical protein
VWLTGHAGTAWTLILVVDETQRQQREDHHDGSEHVIVDVFVPDVEDAVEIGANGDRARGLGRVFEDLAASRKLRQRLYILTSPRCLRHTRHKRTQVPLNSQANQEQPSQ